MGKLTSLDIALSVLYATAAIALLFTAYRIYLKRLKRSKLEAMNCIRLVTSRDNVFKHKTKFLIEVPTPCLVQIDLLDSKECLVSTLVNQEVRSEEFPFDFDPTNFTPGKYYLSLSSEHAKILRGITIV